MSVHRAITAEIEQLLSLEAGVRVDEPDSIHQFRVSMRRLRSLFGSFRAHIGLFDSPLARHELRWLGMVFGPARDAEVAEARLAAEFTALAAMGIPEHLYCHAGDRLISAQQHAYRTAHEEAVAALDSDRFSVLAAMLRDIRDQMSAEDALGQSVMTAVLATEYRRLTADIAAEATSDAARRLDALHSVRKSAKRVRYVAEVIADSAAGPFPRIALAAKGIQSTLGDHRDAVLTRELILTRMDEPESARYGFAYGYLCRSLDQAAAELIGQYQPALDELVAACSALD